MLFNNFCFVGFTAPSSMYYAYHIKIDQCFSLLVLFTFFCCPFIFCCWLFSFITGITMTYPFAQTANTSPSSSKYLPKTSIRLPTILVSTFEEPRYCIPTYLSPKPLSINYFSKLPRLQLTSLPPLFFLHLIWWYPEILWPTQWVSLWSAYQLEV